MTPQQLLKKAIDSKPTAELDAQMKVLREAVPQGMLRGVTEALQVSYEQLSPEAQKATHLLAQLAPEPIPEILIEALNSDLLSPIVRTILKSRSIIMPVTGSTVPMFGTIHRVLADFLRRQSEETDREIQLLAVGLQTIMTPDACRDPSQWPLMTTCMPHCREILFGLQDCATEQHGRTIIHLRLDLGNLYRAQGLYEVAREQEEHAVSYARTNFGEEDPHTFRSLGNLALTLFHQGNYAGACGLQRQVLKLSQSILGEEHPDTLTAISHLALTLARQGDYAGAVALQRSVIDPSKRIFGEEHPDTLAAMNNLALTLFYQGQYAGAAALQRLVLVRRQRHLGAEHPHTLTAMGNLALTLARQGEYVEARALQSSELERRQRIQGEEHPETLIAMGNLAGTLSQQGEYAKAVALQGMVVERTLGILGKEHPATSLSAWNYMNTLLQSGDTETASRVQRQYLLWLLEHDPSTLGGSQQRIRAGVAKLLETAKGS